MENFLEPSKAKNKNRRLVALNRGFYDAELRSVIGNFPVKVFLEVAISS